MCVRSGLDERAKLMPACVLPGWPLLRSEHTKSQSHANAGLDFLDSRKKVWSLRRHRQSTAHGATAKDKGQSPITDSKDKTGSNRIESKHEREGVKPVGTAAIQDETARKRREQHQEHPRPGNSAVKANNDRMTRESKAIRPCQGGESP